MHPLLEITGLCKRYGSIVVADGIDLQLGDRECLGVIGPNGAGKSSLFNMLTGVIRPDAGRIALSGTDITAVAAHRRPRLGVVRAFQIPQCFHGLTVFENVLLAAFYGAGLAGAEAQDWARETLQRTHLADKSGLVAGKLRLIDRKRLELAKALGSRARLLLLDEIAGGLTDAETEALVRLVDDLKQDHAIIWIEHIPHALKAVADRVMVLHFGRKLLDGRPDEVMDSPVVREIYMGLPANEAA